MNDVKKTVCAGSLLFRLDESGKPNFLLVQHAKDRNNFWGVPKGHQEIKESLHETAMRETFEETGIVPRIIMPLPLIFSKSKNEFKSVYLFLARPLNETIRFDTKEIKNVCWFDLEKLPEVYVYQKPAIIAAKNSISKYL